MTDFCWARPARSSTYADALEIHFDGPFGFDLTVGCLEQAHVAQRWASISIRSMPRLPSGSSTPFRRRDAASRQADCRLGLGRERRAENQLPQAGNAIDNLRGAMIWL